MLICFCRSQLVKDLQHQSAIIIQRAFRKYLKEKFYHNVKRRHHVKRRHRKITTKEEHSSEETSE